MPRRAVVISFDHLHLGFLGCYGNDWIETPNLDRLATQAVVFDRHFAESPDPAVASQGWWSGRGRPLNSAEASQADHSLPETLEQRGVRTTLLIESDGRISTAVAPAFEEIVEVRGVDSLDVEEAATPFARLVLRTSEWLREQHADVADRLLWIKGRGVPTPWLPPNGFADLYLDEFGLTGDSSAEEEFEDDVEDEHEDGDGGQPDETQDDEPQAAPKKLSAEEEAKLELKYARALYCAYVSWLDRWLGKLLQDLERAPGWEETLLVVTAASGKPLGEHGRLDEREPLLREEWIHTPLIIRLPDRSQDATRRPALVQPVDIAATLEDWFSAAVGTSSANASEPKAAASDSGGRPGASLLPLIRNERENIRAAAVLHSDSEWGLRTDEFLLIESKQADSGGERAPVLLFEKPHDRFDQADVAPQYPQLVDDLLLRLGRCRGETAGSPRL